MKESISVDQVVALMIFWASLILIALGFIIQSYWACFLFLFILPIIFGNHEAIHENILPNKENNKIKRIHNELILLLGFSFFVMNFKLMRQAHSKHHLLGRSGDGYSPDIIARKPKPLDYAIYYAYLTFIPALLNQITGFLLVLLPARFLPLDYNLDLNKDKSKIPYAIIQLCCLFVLILFIYFGGFYKFLIYESFFIFIWSILQNSAHYGLIGLDSKTDLVCSHTYLLQKPFKILTFGSTSHLAHHVNDNIPCLNLYNLEILKEIETKLGVEIAIKYGVKAFIIDILAQFRGPLNVDELQTNWIKSNYPNNQNILDSHVEFIYRKGIIRKS